MNALSRKQRRLRWLIINLIAGATLTLAVGLATPGCGLLPNGQSQSGGDTHMSGSGDMSLSKQFTQEYGIEPATLALLTVSLFLISVGVALGVGILLQTPTTLKGWILAGSMIGALIGGGILIAMSAWG